MSVVVYGRPFSVYVRIVRQTLEEKGVRYELVEIDPFAPGGPPVDYFARHPFGRIPAFEHDGFRLYEAGAISRYVDETFPGPALQSRDPTQRARMNQIISVLDSYAYRTLVWDIFVERVRAPQANRAPDEARVAAALPKAEICLAALEAVTDGAWLAGPDLTLADLHAAPMFAYFRMTPEGLAIMARHQRLERWWSAMAARPSMAATRSPFE
jgi:glutathione S-transferase